MNKNVKTMLTIATLGLFSFAQVGLALTTSQTSKVPTPTPIQKVQPMPTPVQGPIKSPVAPTPKPAPVPVMPQR